MTKEQIMEQYGLDSSHFWNHKQTGKQIISFEVIEKMIDYHNITFEVPTQNYSKVDGEVALLIKGEMIDDTFAASDETKYPKVSAWSFGEANDKNCYIDNKWAMAEKRGKGRVVMKLLGFYGGNSGFYSDVEMEIQGEVMKNADFGL